MNTELKKNFVLSLILHAAVLACMFLVTAFAPQPRIDTTIMMSIGGPGEGGGGGEEAPPPPPAAKEETPPKAQEQKEPEKVVPAQREEPKPQDIAIPKDPPKKKLPEKKPEVKQPEVKKVDPKKETEPKVKVSTKVVTKSKVFKQSSQPKQLAKNDPRYSADAIRGRLGKAVNSVKVGTPGSGQGTGAGGGGSQFGEYYSMLSSILYEAWDTPGTATPSMSTVVQVRITNDGNLSFLKIVRKSGSDIMDESVISAVVKTKKVPPPPAGLGNSPEVTITFQPDGA